MQMAKPEPDALDDHRLAEAEADIEAGRFVSNAEVIAWLKTWGTADEGPAPDAWFK
jgi:predicted transcriptional regulator